MIPKKLRSLASIYGCEIIEKYSGEGDALFARYNKKEEFICREYYANHVDLDKVRLVLQNVSGKTLAQFWIGGSEASHE